MEFNNTFTVSDSLGLVNERNNDNNYQPLNNMIDFPSSLDHVPINSLAFRPHFNNSPRFDSSLGQFYSSLNTRPRTRNQVIRNNQNGYERQTVTSFARDTINITIEYENPETKTLLKNK